MGRRKCPKCGKNVAEDMKFCPYCGITMPEINKCPKCGKELQEDMTFCPYCGFSLQEKKCPNCGTPIEKDAKYCYSCGLDIMKGLVCKKCGTKLVEGSIFCPKCGEKFVIRKEPETKKQKLTGGKKCIACGTFVEKSARFCSACGNVVIDDANIAYNHLKWQTPKKVIRLSATKKLSLSEAVLNYADCAVFDGFRNRKIEKELDEKYTELFPDFQSFMEKAGTYFTDLIQKEVSDACKVLREKYGIKDVAVDNFFSQSDDYSMSLEWAYMIDGVGQAFFQSINAIEEAKKYRDLNRQSDRKFVGGGIGIGGAISGMITAEVLNGVWDGMKTAFDNLQYSRDCSKNKAEAYAFIKSDEFKEKLLDSVFDTLDNIGRVMAEIIYKEKGIYSFNPYYADILTVEDAEEAVENAKKAMAAGNKEIAQDMIIEALEINPYPSYAGRLSSENDPKEKYYILFKLFGNDNHQVSDLIQAISPKSEMVNLCFYVLNKYMGDVRGSSFDEVKTAESVTAHFINGMDIPQKDKEYYINEASRILQKKYL